jgi:hypothetical protein
VHILLAALFFFAILTLWVAALWPVAVFEIGVFAVAAVAVLRARRDPLPFSWPLVVLSFAVLWGVLQLLTGHTVYDFNTGNAVVQWTAVLATYFIGISLFRSSAGDWFRLAMLWFGFLISVLAILQTFTSSGRIFWVFPTGYNEVMGPFLYRNHYAAFIETVLPLALYEAMHRERPSLLYSAIAAALYSSVIASASRTGSMLATAEIIAVPMLLWWRGRADARAVGSSVFSMAVLLAVFTAIVGPQTVWLRFWAADPYAVRRELAVASLHMVSAHPWFGTGLGTWPTAYPSYAVADFGVFANQSHSDWLQWAAEGGIPFALMLATLFFWSIRPALRSVWGLGVLSVFIHATVDYPFSRPALASWFILLMSLLAVTELPHANLQFAKPPTK